MPSHKSPHEHMYWLDNMSKPYTLEIMSGRKEWLEFDVLSHGASYVQLRPSDKPSDPGTYTRWDKISFCRVKER